MLVYRPQRGTLTDAMKEVKNFTNESDLFQFISNQYDGMIRPEDIELSEDSISDHRVGWDNVHMVLAKRIGDLDLVKIYGCGQCIGFVNISNDVDKEMVILN